MKKRLFTASSMALLAATAFATALGGAPAYAQTGDYPNKVIKIIVPFTAGSATDIMARIVGERLTASMGQPVVIENRPGAGGTLGAAQVAKSEPDGYTLLVVSTGHVVNPALYGSLPYDTVADFAGVTPLAALPNMLVVASNSPFKSMAELIAAAKAKPNQLNYASAGVGSATHVNAEKFRAATGTQITHIPFKGTPETIVEVSAGRVDFMFTPVLSSIPSIRENRMRALAVSTAKRSTALPDVPTVAEAGLPGFVFDFWIGLLAPAKTPRPIVNKLNAEVRKVLAQPEVLERLSKLGAEPMPMTPERFDAYIKEEFNTLGTIMKAAPQVNLNINGSTLAVQADENTPLLYVLRNDCDLKGTRFGCGAAQCGSCHVLIDGVSVPSCDTPLWAAEGKAVTTVEGLVKSGELSALQQAFVDEQAAQCGYCISGMLISATELLQKNQQPTEADVRTALDKHLCRCGSHNRIVRAVLRAAKVAA